MPHLGIKLSVRSKLREKYLKSRSAKKICKDTKTKKERQKGKKRGKKGKRSYYSNLN